MNMANGRPPEADHVDSQHFTAASEAFTAWLLVEPGASISPHIKLVDYRARGAGRGVEAVADIPADADLFTIPRSSVLSVQNSDLPAKLPSVFSPGGTEAEEDEQEEGDERIDQLSPWTALILVMIYEYMRPDSRWRPYLDILPHRFDTLMFWSHEELSELQGCAVLDKIGKEAADEEFRANVLPVLRAHKEIFFPSSTRASSGTSNEGGSETPVHPDSDNDLLALSHRMASTIMAYAFDLDKDRSTSSDAAANGEEQGQDGYMTDSSADEDDNPDSIQPKGMVPLADLLNADVPPNASLFQSPGSLTMKALRPIRAGEEILNDYGPLPRSDLLRRYGYLTPRYKRFDCVEVKTEDILSSLRAHAQIEEEDLQKRLAFLERRELLEDSYDLVWPESSDGNEGPNNTGDTTDGAEQDTRGPGESMGTYMSPALLCVILTLLADQASYKLPATDPVAAQENLPFAADVRRVMAPVLEARMAQYAGDVGRDAALLDGASVTGRRRMAIEVRKGEMELLQAALDGLQERDRSRDDDKDGHENGEPQSKRRKVG